MSDKKTALLFPGQGSQEKGMGRELAETDKQFMDLWKKAEKISNFPLREIFWDGKDREMSRTEYLQPGLTVVNLNLWLKFREKQGYAFTAGHSLGEFCALCAAGVLSMDQTLEVVSLRGRLMAESDSGGAMAAVLKIRQEDVEQLARKASEETGKTLLVANYNTPRQFVVSGAGEAIEAIESHVKEARGRLVKLPVSGAFHSPLMNEAARELSRLMDKLEWKTPKCAIYFNSTADSQKDPEQIKKIMHKQMVSPVYFVQLINAMHADGAVSFVELGPKGVLTRMIPQILGSEADVQTTSINSISQESELS